MLESADQRELLERLYRSGLKVQLPESLHSFFDESGYTATTAQEFRCNARLRVRSIGDLLITHTPTAIQALATERQYFFGKALIKDLSRSGIGILYHQQLYPEEQFELCFQRRKIEGRIVRCRRIGEKCFEIGAKILSIEVAEAE